MADPASVRNDESEIGRPEAAVVTAPVTERLATGDVGDRFFRHIVASMRNGVLATSRDGLVVAINDEARRILGIRPQPSPAGRPVADVLAEHPELVRLFADVHHLNHLPNRSELRLKPGGRVIGYTLALVRDERGRTRGTALLFKDLTLVEQAEERERLRDRLAALGEMAATIAHEVKNPLTGIELMAGLLRRQVQDRPDVHELLAEIITEAKKANAIVLEVLDFVRPIRLQVSETSLREILQDAITAAERKSPRRDTVLVVDVPADLPDLQADAHQLTQLVTNLLQNALEALAGRGTIRVRADARGREDGRPPMVALVVSDDGPGLPAEIQDRLFRPFVTTKPQGSGLGLAIVRKIVDAHEGRIDVATGPGSGTTFTILLPVAPADHLPFDKGA
jgi:signal transduction histidine kinase